MSYEIVAVRYGTLQSHKSELFYRYQAYGEPDALPVSESYVPQPKNMYGGSKLAGEAYCRAFNNTTSLRCTIIYAAARPLAGDQVSRDCATRPISL